MEQKLQPQAPTQPKQTPQHPPKQNHEKSPPNTTITKSNNNSNGNSNNNDNNIVNNSNKVMNNKKAIWDCGSTLYDSFELNSLQKQLDSAIINSTRTMSMPRLPSRDHRAQPQPQPPPPTPPSKKSKFSRSFQKLIRSIFRAPKHNNNDASRPNYDSSSPDPWFLDQEQDKNNMKVVDRGRYFVVFEKPNGLSTIPEVPEVGFSPEIRSLVRKTMSDRFSFTPPITSDGIYCV